MSNFVPSTLQLLSASVFLVWKRKYARLPPALPLTHGISDHLPFVTILRPVKGVDPFLHLCLESAALLQYPKSKYELIFCVASPHDPAVPVIRNIITTHLGVNARVLIGEEDVGPNPKIRNLSKGYREARGDIVWILDSNIWVPPGILDRSVRLLEGFDRGGRGYKLVHHLPLCVDVSPEYRQPWSASSPPMSTFNGNPISHLPEHTPWQSFWSHWWPIGGGRLEENFLASSHCKFYTAINTVAIAPCIVGKSNMFRRSHLAEVTRDLEGRTEKEGLLAFAENICEDHLLAERLWLTPISDEKNGVRDWGRHGMGEDVVIQPVSGMSVVDYLARRTRWLRVRKYTTLWATLVEPGTECFLCSFLGAYALTTLPAFRSYVPATWSALAVSWLVGVIIWAAADYSLFRFMHSYRCVEIDENTPRFIVEMPKRNFNEWLAQWIGREFFALWIWLWAMWPGEVNWRGGRYKVRWKDSRVEEIRRSSEKKD